MHRAETSVFRNIVKVMFYLRSPSRQKKRAQELLPNGEVRRTWLPTFKDWYPFDVIELDRHHYFELVYRSLVVFAKVYKPRLDRAEIRVVNDDNDQQIMHVFLYNEEEDKAFAESYEGKQVGIRNTKPLGISHVDIARVGYKYDTMSFQESKILSGDLSFQLLVQTFVMHKPECAKFIVYKNTLLLDFKQGTDVMAYVDKVAKERQDVYLAMRDPEETHAARVRLTNEAMIKQREKEIARLKMRDGVLSTTTSNFYDERSKYDVPNQR